MTSVYCFSKTQPGRVTQPSPAQSPTPAWDPSLATGCWHQGVSETPSEKRTVCPTQCVPTPSQLAVLCFYKIILPLTHGDSYYTPLSNGQHHQKTRHVPQHPAQFSDLTVANPWGGRRNVRQAHQGRRHSPVSAYRPLFAPQQRPTGHAPVAPGDMHSAPARERHDRRRVGSEGRPHGNAVKRMSTKDYPAMDKSPIMLHANRP